MMEYIVDRIEKNVVICENQETKKLEEFELKQFPEGVKDGDCVVLKDGKFEKNEKETKNKKQQIEELMKKLMKG